MYLSTHYFSETKSTYVQLAELYIQVIEFLIEGTKAICAKYVTI